MANVRTLKKDIDFVTNELVIECFTYNFLFPEQNKEEIALLISDIIKTGDELLNKVNGVKATKENSAKTQFKEIRKEFIEKIEGFVQRLENLHKE